MWFKKTELSPKYYLIHFQELNKCHFKIKVKDFILIMNRIWVDMFYLYQGAEVNTEVPVTHLEFISAPALRSILMMLT